MYGKINRKTADKINSGIGFMMSDHF